MDDNFFTDGTRDTIVGFIVLVIGWLLGIVNYKLGMLIGAGIAIYFFATFVRDIDLTPTQQN